MLVHGRISPGGLLLIMSERPEWCIRVNKFCNCSPGYGACPLYERILATTKRGENRQRELERIAEEAEDDPTSVAARCLRISSG
jgi:hypothetical protein